MSSTKLKRKYIGTILFQQPETITKETIVNKIVFPFFYNRNLMYNSYLSANVLLSASKGLKWQKPSLAEPIESTKSQFFRFTACAFLKSI